MSLKTLRNIILGLSIFIIGFGIGINAPSFGIIKTLPLSSEIVNKISSKPGQVDFSLFWDVWERLNRFYIDKKALDPQKMVYGAISGMVNSLGDPYTVFLPPEQNKEAKDDLSGKLEGIGVQLGIKDKKIIVIAPLKDTPAEKAGLQSSDWIIKVDGKETADWTLPEAVSKIRGPKGSKVTLTVIHKDASQSADITVIRDSIKVASVEWRIKKFRVESREFREIKEECSDCEKVIYLKLSRFGDQTTDEWNKAIEEIVQAIEQSNNRAMKGLIFDLRNNPGGYLSGSVFIASEFLSDGTVVIQETADSKRQTFDVNRKAKLLNIPMVVLINKGTASAGEIVAGVLQEKGKAKLVGEATFGKGSIQEAQDLPQGTGIHITTSKWLLPSGKWINGSGVAPDVKIENDVAKPDIDLQLEKAIEILIK